MGLFSKLFGGKGKAKAKAVKSGPKPTGQSCGSCLRKLFVEDAACPFCGPQRLGEEHPEEDFESTMQANFEISETIGSLGGVVKAHSVAKKYGANGFLHVFKGGSRGVTVLVGDKPVSIGRKASKNVMAIDDSGASGCHCEVAWSGGNRLFVTDAGSTNGTHVNDAVITGPRALDHGDIIALNNTHIFVGVLG